MRTAWTILTLAAMFVAGCEDGLGTSLSRQRHLRADPRTVDASPGGETPDMPRSGQTPDMPRSGDTPKPTGSTTKRL
jgi:hypothetical protein